MVGSFLWKVQFRHSGHERSAFVIATDLDAALRKVNTAYAIKEGGNSSIYFLSVAVAEGEFFG